VELELAAMVVVELVFEVDVKVTAWPIVVKAFNSLVNVIVFSPVLQSHVTWLLAQHQIEFD
jgi:hypothetical protein